MKDGGVGDHADGCVIHPLPENNLFRAHMRLNLRLRLDVEYLKLKSG